MDHQRISAPSQSAFQRMFPTSRIAVSLLFLVNGFMIGSWAPKIPEFAQRLTLSEGELGLMILMFGVGSLTMMPIAGAQIAKRGSTIVVKVLAVLLMPTLLALTLADAIWSGVVAIFLFGGFLGAMDVAMNANAVEIEKSLHRAIMSSCHAFWSLGGLIGSAAGGYLIAFYGTFGHAVILTIAAVATLAAAWRFIFADSPHPEAEKVKVRLNESDGSDAVSITDSGRSEVSS